ncbi:MAG: tRNA methyltransferase [Methanofollis sp.]|nr:tRNA methyltransferase [Methanofollis sp.]
MKAGLLFSGGKDSALAAVMLARDYEVELNTFVFDPARDVASVRTAAEALGLPWQKRAFGPDLLDEAVEMVIASGYPNDAITMVHRQAVHLLAQEYRVVGDGTRFNDRVPMLTRSDVLSIADRYDCSYVRPLLGYGKAEVERLAQRHLVVAYGETGTIENGDYEYEIRAAVERAGKSCTGLFPSHHEQSLVTGATGT